MHFALPPRKTSRSPSAAARSVFSPYLRRSRRRPLAWAIGGIVLVFLVLWRFYGGDVSERIPPGTPEIVLVTVIDNAMHPALQEMIRDNRRLYAARHGYATFLPNLTDYDLSNPSVPSGWARIPATRHAMNSFPHSTHFFYLDQHALILRPILSLTAHILAPTRLESLMIPDKPVVPPDSVIKTFHHRRADQVDLILTQDHEGLSQGAFILRRGEWAEFFLDSWFDPLYRSYNFQRGEGHALEHLVQWHGTVLSRLAIIPQNIMNSYSSAAGGTEESERYKDGDFVVHLRGCNDVSDDNGLAACVLEATRFVKMFEAELNSGAS